MSTAITFPANNDLSGLRLEHTPNKHVVTPFFTFSLTDEEKIAGPYNYNSRYHEIKYASVKAFAALLGIRERSGVMVTEKKMPNGELWWRLGTVTPHELPKPKSTPKPVLPENRGAIDI